MLSRDKETAARWARIDRRADQRKQRQRPRASMAALRIAELSRIFLDCYGREMPNDDAGRDDVEVMAHHIAGLSKNPRGRILDWIVLRAPWMGVAEAEALADRVLQHRIRWTADRLAHRIGLTASVRRRLNIRTIGATDETKEERAARRKTENAAAALARRRACGAKSRQEYRTAIAARGQPWLVVGISRRTWYRRRANP